MRTLAKAVCFLCVFLATVGVPVVRAAWVADGVTICTATGNQYNPQIISDGAGGAIITWEDIRSGSYDIYAQRVNAAGAVQWMADGVAICTASGYQYAPQLTSDGAGGAIITWDDNRSGSSYDIYAQRVNAAGAVQWMADGVAICTALGDQYPPQLTSDGAGGAIITWQDARSGDYFDIYAQRVNATGVVQWTADGVAICTATGYQQCPEIISDGAGGAIITWNDNRNWDDDIYAQRVNASGAVQWMADGVAICTATNSQFSPQLISDGAGGAIITWYDIRSGNDDIYAQHVNTSGVVKWVANGVGICTAAGYQVDPEITSDGAGGAIITWPDCRSGYDFKTYAQRVNASGAVQWTANGVVICTGGEGQDSPQLTSDGANGAIITWCMYPLDIYAQRVNAAGAVQWTASGVAICTATGNQSYPKLTSDGAGGAIITWYDYRSGSGADIYAQRVPAGMTDVPLTSKVVTGLSQNAPNPFNPITHIKFSVAAPGEVSLRIYDIGGRVLRTLVKGWREPGVYSEVWDGKGEDGSVLPSGVYFYSLKTGEVVATKKMVLLK